MKILFNGYLCLIAALILCGGCATAPKQFYQGEPLPADQISIIRGTDSPWSWSAGGMTFFVLGVDGEFFNHFWSALPKEVHVLPGEHKVKIRADGSTMYFDLFFDFETEAGKTYLACGETRGVLVKYKFWIEELSSSNTVAGPIYFKPTLFGDGFTTNPPPEFSGDM